MNSLSSPGLNRCRATLSRNGTIGRSYDQPATTTIQYETIRDFQRLWAKFEHKQQDPTSQRHVPLGRAHQTMISQALDG